jgi:hypothetical protein
LVIGSRRRLLVPAIAAVATAAVACSSAPAAPSPEQQLASRYAPVVALKQQKKLCERGEAYRPVPVDVVLGRRDVSLFDGAEGAYRRLLRGPRAADLAAGPLHHYVDLPGHPVSGRCGYQHWFKRVGAGAPNAVYAHVAKERGRPGRLALQYWLYYVYNDYNDRHESDWELVQLHFRADAAAEALGQEPVEVLYSQHEGAEVAGWGDDKLEKVDRTHVVTYPGAGSHANYFRNALWLGRSADEGLGCDDSTAPSVRVRPRAIVLPTAGEVTPDLAWVTFEGHWGQRERGFNNGPLGPNAKVQWTQPFTWAESVERTRSFAIPRWAHAGLDSSDFFCVGVTGVSEGLDAIYASRTAAFGVLAVLVALVVLAATMTRWRPARVRPLEQRRAAGQILVASLGVYRLDWPTLFVVSALAFPVTFVGALAVHLLLELDGVDDLTGALGRETVLPLHGYVIVLIAIEIAALGFAVAATALVVGSLRLDEGRAGTVGAYRLALRHARPLAGVLLRALGIPLLLASTIVGIPFAIWYLGRTAVAVPACVIEDLDARAAIERSKHLVGRHFWRVSVLTVSTVGAALLLGPFVGAVVLLETDLPILAANVIGMAVSAAVLPVAGIAITLLFLDLRVREREAAPEVAREPVPA